ncbi:MAG TPA: helix-turn-helix domain-containing protein [Egibacteraceae bacterium]|nr:helix-turn-helix domain-containing protein [Egibacteraceae bacterium]
MTRRSYGQACPLAAALDRVGERWTALVIRDLASGPRRYSDLLRGLPGIGTTLLAERLRSLQDEGLVAQRELPPPAASTVYELTTAGWELAAALAPLAAWGTRFVATDDGARLRPEWLILAMAQGLSPADADGVRDVYEFHVDGTVFHVAVEDGRLSGAAAPAPRPPDAVIRTDWTTLLALGSGALTPREALEQGRAAFDGDPAALARCGALLGRPATTSRPAGA